MKYLKTLSFLGLMFCMLGGVPAVLAEGSCKVMSVSAHPDAPPVMWKEGNNIQGIGIDVISTIAKDLGLAVETPYKGPWKRVLRSLEMGTLDLIAGLYKTNQREQVYAYSDHYMDDPVAIVTSKNSPFFFSGWESLIGRHGAATLGDSYGQAFDRFMDWNLEVDRVSSYKQLFKLLQEGRVDYGIGSLHALRAHLKQGRFEQKIHIQQHLVITEKLYMAMSKKGRCLPLLDKINQQIQAMKKDGRMDAIIEAAILRWSQR